MFIAPFILAPVLGLPTYFIVKRALRGRPRGRAIALVAAVVAVWAVSLAMGIYQLTYTTPANMDPKDVPGTYVLLGRDARDEVVLSPDGTLARVASYRGVTQHQSGRWSYEGRDNVSFEVLEPWCLRSTEAPGTTFHYREPDQVLCTVPGGGVGAQLCRAGGRIALCLGEEGYEYMRQ
jgi:hypothetical protein